MEVFDGEIHRRTRRYLRIHLGLRGIQSGVKPPDVAIWRQPRARARAHPHTHTPPQPRPLPSVDFTEIDLGQTVTSVVPTPAPPCAGEPQWPCQYFRFTAPSDGLVTVELRYRPETQPPGRFGVQGVDISVVDGSGREIWADFFSPSGVTGARLNVKEGVIYQITLWYTYPRLEYELETALHR